MALARLRIHCARYILVQTIAGIRGSVHPDNIFSMWNTLRGGKRFHTQLLQFLPAPCTSPPLTLSLAPEQPASTIRNSAVRESGLPSLMSAAVARKLREFAIHTNMVGLHRYQ
jgi:hypothetical protein